MFNPPGGDWSGVSYQLSKSTHEARYLTLPRAPDSSKNKRPDHIYYDSKNNVYYLIESKIFYNDLKKEIGVGDKMVNWTKSLLKHTPQVKRKINGNWDTNTSECDRIKNPKFIKCGAILKCDKNTQSINKLIQLTSLDIMFIVEIENKKWTVKYLTKN